MRRNFKRPATDVREAVEPGIRVIFLEGQKVILRPLEKADLNRSYLSWLNDSEVARYLISTAFPTNMDQLETFYQRVSASRTDVMLAIVSKETDRHIGNIKLGNINWVHRFADLGIMIGDKGSWGKGLGQEACRLLVGHAFMRLNLNKVTLSVYGCHSSAVKAYENVGFRVEGCLKSMLYNAGRYEDQLIMAITKHQYVEKQ